MQELLQEILEFLQANNLNNFLTSLIISIIGVIVAFVRTSKKSIQSKSGYVNLSQFNVNDYVIIYNNEILTFNLVTIKKKTDLTKLEKNSLIDKGGVFNVTKKNE